MELTIKHINRKDDVKRRLDALIQFDHEIGLTEVGIAELQDLRLEYFNLIRIDTVKFRLWWNEEYYSAVERRHILAQSLSAIDPATTIHSYRRKMDYYCSKSLRQLNSEAADAIAANKASMNKLDDLRSDVFDSDLLDVLISEEETDSVHNISGEPEKNNGANTFIIHEYKKSTGKDDSGRDEFAKKLGEPKSASGPVSVDDVDELFSALHEEAPWLNEPIKRMWLDARANAAAGAPFGFDPILIFGAPGLGKTHLAKLIAGMASCPSVTLQGGNMTAAFDIGGTEKQWRGSGPGVCVRAIHDNGAVNPLILFDEIDKTIRHSSGGGSCNGSPATSATRLCGPSSLDLPSRLCGSRPLRFGRSFRFRSADRWRWLAVACSTCCNGPDQPRRLHDDRNPRPNVRRWPPPAGDPRSTGRRDLPADLRLCDSIHADSGVQHRLALCATDDGNLCPHRSPSHHRFSRSPVMPDIFSIPRV